MSSKQVSRTFFIVGFILTSNWLNAQDTSKKSSFQIKERYSITTEFQTLRTTHATYFNGGSLTVGYFISPRVVISAGVEYSYDYFHNDNGWNLYQLKIVPFFIDAKFLMNMNKRITPYFELSQGMSFINYRKEDQLNVFAPYHVSEKGYYVYGGTGASIKIAGNLSFQIGVGFKAFHISSNVLEVNPHGLTFRSGVSYRF